MDSITQIVLGAAVGEAVAGKKIGGKAALWGAIGGTIPDLDVFANAFMHPIDAALIHRGFSHSILFSILMAPILGFLIHRLYKKRFEFKMWRNLFFFSLITHPLLDIFTNYGTSLFWPLNWRVSINSVFVMDPLYTIPFSFFLLIALFIKRSNKWRRRMNWTGIIYSCVYLLWGVVVKQVILSESTDYFKSSNIHVNETRTSPMPLTSFYWSILGQDEENYYYGYKSIFKPFNSDDIQVIPKNHELLEELSWSGKNYSNQLKFFSNGWYGMDETSTSVKFYDMRFGSFSMLTHKKNISPVMGFSLEVKNDTIVETNRLGGKNGFDDVDLDFYWNKIF